MPAPTVVPVPAFDQDKFREGAKKALRNLGFVDGPWWMLLGYYFWLRASRKSKLREAAAVRVSQKDGFHPLLACRGLNDLDENMRSCYFGTQGM